MVKRNKPTVEEAVAAVSLVNGDWEMNKSLVVPGGDEDEPTWAVIFYDDCFKSGDVAVFPAVICVFDSKDEADAFPKRVLPRLT